MMAARTLHLVPPAEKPLVLIVDDEPQILDALKDLLEDDFKVITACKGEEALTHLGREDISVVLSDQRMPGLSGDQLLKEASLQSQATRVLVTGYTDISALIKAVNNGQIYAYVSKPWKALDMKLLVQKAADHHGLQRRYLQQVELLTRLMNHFPDYIYFKDMEGRFVRCNLAFANSLGFENPDELRGRTDLQIHQSKESLSRHQEDLEIIGNGGSVLDRSELSTTRGGQQIWLSVTKLPLPELGLVCVARDITERKRLATEREVFFLNTFDLMAVCGLDGKLSQLNPAWSRTLGWKDEDHLATPLLHFVHPDDRIKTEYEFSKLVSAGDHCTANFENRYQHQDGSYRWLMWTLAAVPGEQRIFAAARDVSDRKREEQRLIKQARQQGSLADLARLGLAGVAFRELCQEAVETVRGHLAVEFCGLFVLGKDSTSQMIAGVGYPEGLDSQVWLQAPMVNFAVKTGRITVSPDFSQEDRFPLGPELQLLGAGALTLIDGSDSEAWGILQVLSKTPRPFPEEDIHFLRLVSSVLSLVVRKKAAQEELEVSQQLLLQSQKLEAIGRMAGGIAHDFNNILTVIRGNAEMLPESIEVEEIQEATDKAVGLVRQLMAFARQQPINTQVVDLNLAVERDERLLRRLVSEDVRFEVITSGKPAWTTIDSGQLTQVLANLVSNARDAIEGHGEITITVFHSGQDHVGIEVRDSGTGIDSEVLDQIFQPFFTTKPVGQGTGLGLATSYGIIRHAGGTLEANSCPGKGTSFTILLPRSKESDEETEITKSIQSHVGVQSTVLVVDDEGPIVRILSRTLRRAGCEVHETLSSQEALKIAAQLGKGLNVLITDIIMPDLGGPELAQQLKRGHPGLKVLFVSGYSENAPKLEPGVTAFLAKPFSSEKLLEALHGLLEKEL